MGRVLKWIGLVVGGLVVLLILALGGLYFSAQSRLDKTYNVKPAAVTIPATPAALDRGRHLAASHCAGCHGENFAGTPFFDDPGLGKIPAPNLTKGRGGVGATYSDADWVRAIRHGLRRDGKPFLIMPAEAFYWLSDDDLGAVIAFVQSVPAVDNDLGSRATSPLANVLLGAGVLGNVITAELVDHNAPRPPAPVVGVTPAYGEYLMKSGGCQACHGAALTGGQPSEPGAPFAPSLTPGGNLGKWSETDFLTAFRTRKSRFMPYEYMGRMSDDEIKALWLYLKSLPVTGIAKK